MTIKLIVTHKHPSGITVMLEPMTPYVRLEAGEHAEIELSQPTGNEIEINVEPGLVSVWTLSFNKGTIESKGASLRPREDPMTEFVFREDSYARTLDAAVTAIGRDGILLDRTIFYAASGGQPNDTGRIIGPSGAALQISGVVHPQGDKTRILHELPEGSPTLSVGDRVSLEIDWDRRYRLMRMHTALHLLSVVLPFPVTGGSIGEDKGRLDFDMPEVPADLAALEARLNEMVSANHAVTQEWITDEEMAANPGLIKTMKVKPPVGQGRVRLIRIGDVDLQPCGGTHVRATGEIGPLKIGKIEKKGAQNRRVALHFA